MESPNMGDPIGPEVSAFIQKFIGGMFERSEDWKADESKAAGELGRAVGAIKIAVYRDLATRKAKEELSHEEQDRTAELQN
jgi:hypothetical protein